MTASPTDRFAAPRPVPKPGILDIHAYVGGKSKVEGVAHPVKLSSNENVLGSSDKAKAAYRDAVDRMHIYPDGKANILREAVAKRFNLEPERLTFGDGSDEIFALLCQVYLEPGDNIVQGEHGFAAYAIGARACQGEVRMAKEINHRIDIDEVVKCVDERTRLVFIANPANPTGTWLTGEEIRALHAALPPSVILVLDGAYSEFCSDPRFEDGLDLARAAENVIVTRTFSKLHGLAALRVGWGYAPPHIIEPLERIRPPFNTSIPGQEAAVAALFDDDFQARSLALVEQWRPWLTQQLGGLGLEVTPSAANFVLATFPTAPGKTALEAEAFLASKGYLVRAVANYGLPNAIRITIGLEEQNRAVVDLLAEFLGR
ncbi:histidinol-phosphate transaminase [Caulobacter sp.]|uniref:histidinol-phosphate transaminase n=1 Tax=Caulobacter sp. TaxID=78 RepID=UPI002B49EA91|nr:histidinol-phosphate transaminase [Caulobacter sp.]HJV42948.1 histidinol-phosphate transaminase [Caulobacter sp.]